MSKPISRGTFLKSLGIIGFLGGAAKLAYDRFQAQQSFPCRMLGPQMSLGHRIRDGMPADSEAQLPGKTSDVLIVGGGIAGLSAAWWLKKHGVSNFELLELEKTAGGNSSSGANGISAYPWGAHYVPLANEESTYVKELFSELGIIQETTKDGLPVYDELALCHDPQERLLKDGIFQDGLVPSRGLQVEDKKQIEVFFEIVSRLREARGMDGRPIFAIPIDLSTTEKRYRELDKISMAEWLERNNLKAKPLRWYVDYCCRDDYGSTSEHVSAWAGLHYFAGRRGHAANAEKNSVVTWPEGNGYLVSRLSDGINDKIKTGAAVFRIAAGERDIRVDYLDGATGTHRTAAGRAVVFAAPRFLAAHVIEGYSKAGAVQAKDLTYCPWIVANISLKRVPAGKGEKTAWDNVSYYSKSLGYVVSTHQRLTTRQAETVITYYYPLAQSDPRQARRELLGRGTDFWREEILNDLEQMHPGITDDVIEMELWPWGHGMIRPSVGFLWGGVREKMAEPFGRVFFAHSDMSGISNFEEAQYRGVMAARKAMEMLS